jgi:hypothetical protein
LWFYWKTESSQTRIFYVIMTIKNFWFFYYCPLVRIFLITVGGQNNRFVFSAKVVLSGGKNLRFFPTRKIRYEAPYKIKKTSSRTTSLGRLVELASDPWGRRPTVKLKLFGFHRFIYLKRISQQKIFLRSVYTILFYTLKKYVFTYFFDSIFKNWLYFALCGL